jgi:hypothetical protein
MRAFDLVRCIALPVLGLLAGCAWSIHSLSAARVQRNPGNLIELIYEPPDEEDEKPIAKLPLELAEATSIRKRTKTPESSAALGASEMSLLNPPEPIVEPPLWISADPAEVAIRDAEALDVGWDEASKLEIFEPATVEPQFLRSPVLQSRWKKILPWKWGRKTFERKTVTK